MTAVGYEHMSDRVIITPRAGIRQSLTKRLVDEWPLLRLWTAREFRTRYRQSWLRAGWSVVQPVVLLITYGWVLVQVLDVGESEVPYLTFAWAGLVPFTFMSQCLGQGVGSIQYAGHVISKVYFPREILPLSVVGAACVDLAITTAILVVAAWVQVGPPTVHLIALVMVNLVLVSWTAALTVLAATATVFRRDLGHAMPLILRVLFIVSPVMYPVTLLEERVPALTALNPLTVVIEATRDVATRNTWPAWGPLLGHLVAGSILLAAALLLVRRVESKMPDRV